MEIIAKYIHGSEDSTDVDTYYIVDAVPSFKESKKFCDSIKDENANILELDETGIICKCYKGTPDECNNSLYETYHLHKQEYPLLVKRKVERDFGLKYVRAIRILLSHCSKTQYRKEVKSALKSTSWDDKVRTLLNIDLSTIDYDHLEHNQNGKDIKKVIAFQIGQTILLGCSIEVYTKSEISSFFPELKQFLYREDDVNMDLLNTFKNILIEFFSTDINECGENLVEINGIKYNHREEKKSKLINEDTETKEILA